jgi:hypothetical protein
MSSGESPQSRSSLSFSSTTSPPSALFTSKGRAHSVHAHSYSNSSSAASSDYPPTPAQANLPEPVIERGNWTRATALTGREGYGAAGGGKGKRDPLPPMIDRRFAFPTKRGSVASSLGLPSASGGGGGLSENRMRQGSFVASLCVASFFSLPHSQPHDALVSCQWSCAYRRRPRSPSSSLPDQRLLSTADYPVSNFSRVRHPPLPFRSAHIPLPHPHYSQALAPPQQQ